jgi:hypothetical protein
METPTGKMRKTIANFFSRTPKVNSGAKTQTEKDEEAAQRVRLASAKLTYHPNVDSERRTNARPIGPVNNGPPVPQTKTKADFPEFAKELAADIVDYCDGSGTAALAVIRDKNCFISHLFGPTLTQRHLNQWKFRKWRDTKKKRKKGQERPELQIVTGSVRLKVNIAIARLCNSGSVPVNSTILRPIIRGVITAAGDRAILTENGGNFSCSTTWINDRCRALGLTMRKITTDKAKLPVDYEAQLNMVVLRLANMAVRFPDLTPDLVVNFDHTGCHILPISDITRAEKGARDVSCQGKDDKRQLTAVTATSMSGTMLPLQVGACVTSKLVLIPCIQGNHAWKDQGYLPRRRVADRTEHQGRKAARGQVRGLGFYADREPLGESQHKRGARGLHPGALW